MIELRDFSIGYGQRQLLEDVSVTIPSRNLTALIGRNGARKVNTVACRRRSQQKLLRAYRNRRERYTVCRSR